MNAHVDSSVFLRVILDEPGRLPLTNIVLERAAEPFPTLLGSLDALHLASALLVRERYDGLLFATHDHALAAAARAVGFPVDGV